MREMDINKWVKKVPVLKEIQCEKEVVWINPDKTSYEKSAEGAELTTADIEDTQRRLARFAPFIMKRFGETRNRQGMIESELTPIPAMREYMNQAYGSGLQGRLFLKQDNNLAIAGSVKARGGIYEVLKHTEDLALQYGLVGPDSDYGDLAGEEARAFFGKYTIQVGSTGNLGLSIGIMGVAIGYKVIVHMSADARQWKKELLRSHGVTVVEYESDYGAAVENGRKSSLQDEKSYFVDDENSRDFFLGYATAAIRLAEQMCRQRIAVDREHPLFVHIPCGVGGAPGGISFGLKQIFKDAAHCFFAEPTQAPCMLVGMATGLGNGISVQDIGLSGLTHADGLAVSRPSGFVGGMMKNILSGEFTVQDARLYDYMRDLLKTEGIFLEPSACAAFQGAAELMKRRESLEYLKENDLIDRMGQAVHVVWATGGSLVPEKIRQEYKETYLPYK